jgi:poly(3-hydroxybutyrate) depolymerase
MYSRIAFCLFISFALTANAQTINVRGIVSNVAGKPIANAIVALAGQGLRDTTGADGAYSIVRSTAVEMPVLMPRTEALFIHKGILSFSLPNPSSAVKVEMFDIKGGLLQKMSLQNVPAGFYHFNILENSRTAKLLVIRASIDQHMVTFRYLPLQNDKYVDNQSSENGTPVQGRLTKLAAINDTIRAAASKYTTKSIAISNSDQVLNITLDGGGSIGCGKALSAIKSGTYTITSAGLSRQYIINIPTTYDMNHPYRLIFGMHCYGSSMQGVANENYYQLKVIADSTKNYCIFVAPNGTGNPALWNQGQSDHTFFEDMLKLFKDNLCIDTTRVFSCGFSYGAMFTNSLAQTHQKVLRAVACFAAANYNIWVPANSGYPIAYMGTVGLSDQNCPPPAGRACRDTMVKYNGCTKPATVPEATTTTHVAYDYQGCPDYPVKWCTFLGGHQCYVVDGTNGTEDRTRSWIPGVTWKFFTQF